MRPLDNSPKSRCVRLMQHILRRDSKRADVCVRQGLCLCVHPNTLTLCEEQWTLVLVRHCTSPQGTMLFREFVAALRQENMLSSLESWSNKEIAQVLYVYYCRTYVGMVCLLM